MKSFFRMMAAVLALPLGGASALAGDYAVIVNAKNPVSDGGAETRNLIKRIYLKEITAWVNGVETQPLAREAGSAVQTAFHAKVLEMSESAVNEHWLRLKQTKGETPPREVGSSLILFRLVGKYEGSFAAVTAEEAAAAPPEVKVLFTFSD
ncbi:MAG: hypothetical protein D6782_01195 [Alphaproteobacteria bacterium]|nr:MAG: hypothetical protein D6782_01195 [Alphaproteobacteria bacterium]